MAAPARVVAAAAARPPHIVNHVAGSRAGEIEAWVREYTLRSRGTPSSMAAFATNALGFVVRRQDIWRALHNMQYTSKKPSIVPSLSIPAERDRHIASVAQLAQYSEQVRILRVLVSVFTT